MDVPFSYAYRKLHEYDIHSLDEKNGTIELNKVTKSGEVITEKVTVEEFADQHLENEKRS